MTSWVVPDLLETAQIWVLMSVSKTPLLLPSAYLPPISYMSRLVRSSKTLIEHQEHFVKKSIRNRCEIAGANGRILLSVPVAHANRWRKPICEMELSGDSGWKSSQWKSIFSAYAHAPYFEFYENEFRTVFFEKHEVLTELNTALLKMTLRWLKLFPNLSRTEYFEPYGTASNDLRGYWDKNEPSISGRTYRQVFSDRYGFQHDLSIIDLIFNTGPDAVGYL